jgi:hypothetical protein
VQLPQEVRSSRDRRGENPFVPYFTWLGEAHDDFDESRLESEVKGLSQEFPNQGENITEGIGALEEMGGYDHIEWSRTL